MTPPPPASAAAGPPDALSLERIAKRFGATVALRDASLRVRRGTLHALLGENGAGKSTLVNAAFGLVRPDAGVVRVDGAARRIASPADAIAAGLGMVHQHFLLVPAMTVAENVALGVRGRYDRRRVAERVRAVGAATGLRVDPAALVGELDVAAQQRVEIVKALVRGARVLILDEPTAVLAPDEADELLAWVRRFVDGGNAAVLITHKLREALRHADDVTVLRRGATTLTAPAGAVDEAALVAAMLGEAPTTAGEAGADATLDERAGEAGDAAGAGTRRRAQHDRAVAAEIGAMDAGAPPRLQREPAPAAEHHPSVAASSVPAPRDARPADRRDERARPAAGAVVLRLERAGYRDARGVDRLREATLDVRAGEIVGVAAVEGAGHHELLRLLAGRLRPTSGRAEVPDGVGFVPEDRHRDALVLEQSLTENVVLRDAGDRRGRIRWRAERARTRALLAAYDVRAAGADAPARALSGGNQQKLVLGRELWGDPPALVAESPTRGLDVRAAAAVLARLREARDRGAAVVVYSSDLDELLAVADRVLAVHAGRVREVPCTRDALGRAIVGAG